MLKKIHLVILCLITVFIKNAFAIKDQPDSQKKQSSYFSSFNFSKTKEKNFEPDSSKDLSETEFLKILKQIEKINQEFATDYEAFTQMPRYLNCSFFCFGPYVLFFACN